ncbi:hypothetical protein ABFB09_08035 [Dehalogenimonas sp. THU2]|uniref:hypothetical protein n=1 Tax=Dehalogenimonas sp. THU2 TaxID=3151121 RepID=UPI003218ABD7
MQTQIKRVTDVSTWAASSDLSALSLPREGLITEIKIQANLTMSAALTAVQPDGLFRVIQNLKIEGDGGRAYLGMSGEQMGRLLALWTLYDFGTPMINLQSGTNGIVTFVFHPGSNPADPFDMSAVIPARALSEFLVKLTTTANSVVDDTITLDSGSFRYEVNHILGVPITGDLMTPIGSSMTKTHTANKSDFSEEIDVPTGNWLRRIFMLVQDETATRPVRKNDEVTGIKLSIPGTGQTIFEQTWEGLKVSSFQGKIAGYPFQVADTITGHMNLPDGLAVIDLRKFRGRGFHPVYGMDLRQTQQGRVKLGLTIENYAAGDDTIIYWDQLQAINPSYVGR